MAFNFGNLAKGSGVATVKRRLKPWDIYEVELKDARIDEVKGSKDPSKTYRILKVRFENEQGYYEESIFFPKPGDEERTVREVTNKDGSKRQMELPSSNDRIEGFIQHVAAVLNPDAFVKLQEHAAKGVFKDFDMVAKYFIEKICKPVFGKKTFLKLIGKKDKDGNYQPILPYFVEIRNGEPRLNNNFLGTPTMVAFSEYEERQRNEYLNAKPTNMKAKDSDLDVDSVTKEVDTALNETTKSELDSMLDQLD